MEGAVLELVLNDQVEFNKFKAWIQNFPESPQIFLEGYKDFSQADFAVFFLNFLRKDTARFKERLESSSKKKLNEKEIPIGSTEQENKVKRVPIKQIGKRKDADDSHNDSSVINKSPSQVLVSPNSPNYTENFPELGKGKKSPLKIITEGCQPTAWCKVRSGRRRIKPTAVSTKKVDFISEELKDQKNVDNIFLRPITKHSVNSSKQIDVKTDFKSDRDVIQFQRGNEENSGKSLVITHRSKLYALSKVYNLLMEHNLIPNILLEMESILQLLVLPYAESVPILRDRNYICEQNCSHPYNMVFESTDNCIYFSLQVISQQKFLFSTLDNCSLKLFSEDAKISSFSEELSKYFANCYSERMANPINIILPSRTSSSISTITFQSETDKKNKFPNEKSFRTFCKQRDLFYTLFDKFSQDTSSHIWQISKFKFKVKSILDMCSNPVNMDHLALLVIEQCIKSVIEEDCKAENLDSHLFDDLLQDKWIQLNKRLVEPMGRKNLVSFSGTEIFFKDFILFSFHNTTFLNSLLQVIISKLMDLTNKNNYCSAFEKALSQETCNKFLLNFRTVKILGKLLGLAIFEPFKLDAAQSTNFTRTSIDFRSQILPPIDLVMWFEKAIRNGSLLLTVPWIIECLKMIDGLGVNTNTPHVIAIVRTLVSFYRSTFILKDLRGCNINDDVIKLDFILTKVSFFALREVEYSQIRINYGHLKPCVALLLRLYIGSLFNETGFPEGSFYEELVPKLTQSEVMDLSLTFGLDCSNLLSTCLFEKLIPELSNLKYTIINYPSQNSSVKHITPIKISSSTICEPIFNDKLQIELEASFFNRYKGLQDTIETISDTIASLCKNYISSHIIDQEKRNRIEELNDMKGSYSKARLMRFLPKHISKSLSDMKTAADLAIVDHKQNRIMPAINSLITSEHGASFLSICEKIATRKFKTEMYKWVNNNFPTEDEIHNELMVEIKKKKDLYETYRENQLLGDPDWSDSLIGFQDLIRHIMFQEEPSPTFQEVHQLLVDVCENNILGHLNTKVLSEVYIMTWDLIIALIAHHPHILTDDLLEYVTDFWVNYHYGNSEIRTLSPRNMVIFCKSKERKTSSFTLAKLISILIKKQVLHLSELEQQALSLLQHSWEQTELLFIQHTITKCREMLRNTHFYNDMKLSLMFEWIAETTAEI